MLVCWYARRPQPTENWKTWILIPSNHSSPKKHSWFSDKLINSGSFTESIWISVALDDICGILGSVTHVKQSVTSTVLHIASKGMQCHLGFDRSHW